MKTAVIYHSADFDGIFCREIARLHFGHTADYIGWNFGEPVPQIEPGRPIVMMDLAIEEIMVRAELVAWIDHHVTSIDKYDPFTPGRRIDGVAACRLAWQHWFGNPDATKEDFALRRVVEPLAVRLAGEFDIWDKRDPRAELFQHGLRSRDLDACWGELLAVGPGTDRLIGALLDAGRGLQYASEQRNAQQIREFGFTVKWEGLTWLALNTLRCNSLTFAAGLRPEHEGCLAFGWLGDKWKVSLYGVPGRPELDLSKIAKKFPGGGGHKQACGFSTAALPFVQPLHVPQAMECIAEALRAEAGGGSYRDTWLANMAMPILDQAGRLDLTTHEGANDMAGILLRHFFGEMPDAPAPKTFVGVPDSGGALGGDN